MGDGGTSIPLCSTTWFTRFFQTCFKNDREDKQNILSCEAMRLTWKMRSIKQLFKDSMFMSNNFVQ